MKAIGYLFVALVGAGLIAAAAVGIRSMDDIKRYARMRSM